MPFPFFALLPGPMAPPDLPHFDFTRPEVVQEWQPAHDIAGVHVTPEGMEISINGSDPYLFGPTRDFPAGQPLWLHVREKSEQGGTGQMFYYHDNPTEEQSVRFPVRPGVWEDSKVQIPPLGPGYHFRFDPPGDGGKCVLQSIAVDVRTSWKAPHWPAPTPSKLSKNNPSIRSPGLVLEHAPGQWGAFTISVDDKPMAIGWNHAIIGYAVGSKEHWVHLDTAKTQVRMQGKSLVVTARVKDPDGGTWDLRQSFFPAGLAFMDVQTEVTVDRDRSVLFLPLLLVFPGTGTFGAEKHQGLFAGLEYLDNEPSSSEADLTVPAHHREVPDSVKITFPLQVIEYYDRYVGLMGPDDTQVSLLYDSPDRIFGSGGHVMGSLFPGSFGVDRDESSLLPYDATTIDAGQPLISRTTLIGGRGGSVVPALKQYLMTGVLAPPSPGTDFDGYFRQASDGWLKSALKEGEEFRHALPGSFKPQPAADAATMLAWMASQATDPDVASRLQAAAEAAIAAVPPQDYNQAGVSHIRYPVESLVWGHTAEAAERAAAEGRALLGRFEPDGSVLYHQAPGHPDYGRTHFAKSANGLTAQVLASLLQDAEFSGDPALIKSAMPLLWALNRQGLTVPRGAQTWEVPLHTPDILAAAYLARAYTLAYELTGDSGDLDQAANWAWTGVPFVYLRQPTDGPVGPYSTIAVLGATNWVAPVWLGMPVQWCGLVYADALYRLNRYEHQGPWRQLADGITASGIRQSWPDGSGTRQGLLPDSFNLRPQTRNDPAINPGTVEMNAIRLFHRPALYDFRVFWYTHVMVHAPGDITEIQDGPGRVQFTVEGWPKKPYEVLIVGLKGTPRVKVNGEDLPLTDPQQYIPASGRLILHLEGKPKVEILEETR